MERSKNKLHTNKSQQSVNKELFQPISLTQESRLLPYNDINKIINENEQFNKERQESTKYRVITTINPLLSNPLFNVTGDFSWSIFDEPLFRDRSYPPNSISINEKEDLIYRESVAHHLIEKDGWFGYYNPKINADNRYLFTHMMPGMEELGLITKTGMNWDLTLTYPAEKYGNDLTNNGLNVIDRRSAKVNGKVMIALGTPYKHNLKKGDYVRISGTSRDGEYEIQRIGLDNGDLKNNYFVIDISGLTFLNKPKFKKLVRGVECEYYFRVFKRIKTVTGNEMGDLDYDIFPLAFSNNLFGDPMVQMVTKNDVDVSDLVDNLGRPISEIYLTYIKKPNRGFTAISSGLLIDNIPNIENYLEIPSIRRIHNGGDKPFRSNIPLNEDVRFSDDSFIGDLVEYNRVTLKETVLSETYHRFNTYNREEGGTLETVIAKRGDGVMDINEEDPWHGIGDNTPPIIGPELPMRPQQMFLFTNTSELDDRNESIDGNMSGGRNLPRGGFNYKPVTLTYNRTTTNICNQPRNNTYYINNDNFNAATSIFTNNSGSNKATAGNYSDGFTVRYWDGNRFTNNISCNNRITSGVCTSRRGVGGGSIKQKHIGLVCSGGGQSGIDIYEYYIDGLSYFSTHQGSGNSSCPSNQYKGQTVTDGFFYEGNFITPPSDGMIKLLDSNYIHNNSSYSIYIVWENVSKRSVGIQAPYFICNDNSSGGDGEDNEPTPPDNDNGGEGNGNPCSGIRAEHLDGVGEYNLVLGGICSGLEIKEWYLDGNKWFSETFTHEDGDFDCEAYEEVNNFDDFIDVSGFYYNGEYISPKINEKIKLITKDYEFNDRVYDVYVIWDESDVNNITIKNPYLVCTDIIGEPEPDEEEDDGTEPDNGYEDNIELVRGTLNLGVRQEGYLYKPFHKIKIREFSNYLEYGDSNTANIPDYATKLNDGRYVWRDLLDIGLNQNSDGLDYPFLNGSHHIYFDSVLSLKRQDPFGEIGLQSDGQVGDIMGNKISQKHKINRAGDEC